MGRKPIFPPKILVKNNGYARVRWAGKEYALGHVDSAECKQRYAAIVSSIARTGSAGLAPNDITVNEVCLWWEGWAQRNYRAGSHEPTIVRLVLKHFRKLYGSMPVRDVGALKVQDFQRYLAVDCGWCRNQVNHGIIRLRTVWKRAAANEQISADCFAMMKTVSAVAVGTPWAFDSDPIEPAHWPDVEKVISFCPAPVAGMLQIQSLTGMRSAEVRTMRVCDLGMFEGQLIYKPATHKNAWRGHARLIVFGPKASAIIQQWIVPLNHESVIFAPWRAHRGQKCGRCYSNNTYPHAVARACEKAGVKFAPYALRHGFKQTALANGSLHEALQAMGQRSLSAFERYGSGLDVAAAASIARKIG